MPKKAGIAIMAAGAVLIISALLLFVHNRQEDAQAGQEAESLLESVEAVIEAQAKLDVAQLDLERAAVEAKIIRTRGEAEVKAKFAVDNEKALGEKRRAKVFRDSSTLADLVFAENVASNLEIRVIHAGEGTLWTDLKGATMAVPGAR